MRKEYPNTYKTKMVEKYKKSKMKISEFCRTNEIPTSTFNRWLLEDKMNLEKRGFTTYFNIFELLNK